MKHLSIAYFLGNTSVQKLSKSVVVCQRQCSDILQCRNAASLQSRQGTYTPNFGFWGCPPTPLLKGKLISQERDVLLSSDMHLN